MGNFIRIDKWGIFPESGKPYIIAGPCSVENEKMLLETASALKKAGIPVMRGGLWKPRTRPDSFEGVGEAGLPWMSEAGKAFGIRTATEVANPRHVELALEYGIDLLWIGARTTGNPFLVQEICEALKGTDVPVLVKNPPVAEPELWIGAIERLERCGIRKIGAVHRGFSTFGKSIYRNDPLWQIPVEIRKALPEIPIFCDPSHIGGNRMLVGDISRKAVSLGFDGLMIETHPDPDNALSDAAQQITPEQLAVLTDSLKVRGESIANASAMSTIEELREEIDIIDGSIIDLIARRMEIVETIGDLKRKDNIQVLQTQRWNRVIEKAVRAAENKNLPGGFIEEIFNIIHREAMERQLRQ